jgi:hypothetical protein
MTQLIEAPAAGMILGTIDDHQALDFKKRWITYELQQGNPHAHLPVVEFFLKQGIKMLPPSKGTLNSDDRLEAVDGEAAAKSAAHISASWIVDQSIFDGKPVKVFSSFTNPAEERTLQNFRGIISNTPT